MNERKEISQAEKEAYLAKLEEKVHRIRTRKDLASFAVALAEANDAGVFDYTNTSSYLEALRVALYNLSGYYKNQGLPEPEQPDWRCMGEILFLAFYN